MRFSVRDLVYIGVFGALWGAVEISLGSVLHMLNVPFSGAVMSTVGIGIALVGRLFVPRSGAILFIGLVTAMLKLFSIGGVILTPLIGILIESALAEVIVDLLGRPRRASFLLAGGVATLWTLFHPLLTFGLIAGQGLIVVYSRTMAKGAAALGLSPASGLLVLAILIVIHFGMGCVAGVVGWEAGQSAQARLRFQEV
jgi:hypothetical protein